MKKHEQKEKENKNKKTEFRFSPDCPESLFEMMKGCFQGKAVVPDCCAGMEKMWEKMQGKAQQKDRKQK
jgi:hypothetical protein